MAKLTVAAAAKFKEIFESLDFQNAAIRLGTRPGIGSTEEFIDFIPDNQINYLNDSVHLTNGIMVVVDRRDEQQFTNTVIDYISEPEGFIFESQG
jgi:Fe-S cluster assembly iron-binding protein IscA